MGCGVLAPERFESIEQLDAQLVGVVRQEAGARLRLGQVLEVMQRKACCFELGFSSLGAYALERCERSVRWVEVACCLARRLEALPLLRVALAAGRVSWSKAELLARWLAGRTAQPENEVHWLALAESHTLRELRREVSKAPAETDAARTEELEATGVLTCTLDREDTWLLAATRALLDQFGTRGPEGQIEALLAEAQGALLAALPTVLRAAMDLDGLEAVEQAQQRWREQLACWRSEAEERCESQIRAAVLERAEINAGDMAEQAAEGMSSLDSWNGRELDGELRRLAAALAGHELKLARLLSGFHRADGWRRLGYATETQYARERLGLSRSSVLARRSMALRLEALPQIAAALGRAQVGVEAALQLVRIATPATELAWLERARQRTVKHLREEVAAAALCAGGGQAAAGGDGLSKDSGSRFLLRVRTWLRHRSAIGARVRLQSVAPGGRAGQPFDTAISRGSEGAAYVVAHRIHVCDAGSLVHSAETRPAPTARAIGLAPAVGLTERLP